MAAIPGLKLIRHTGGENNPDDPSYPYKLEVMLRTPEFMEFTFIAAFGPGEEIAVLGMTEEAINEFIAANRFKSHPRFRSLTITGPQGVIKNESN